MTSAQSKRQKLSGTSSSITESSSYTSEVAINHRSSAANSNLDSAAAANANSKKAAESGANNFGVDVDDLTDDSYSGDEDEADAEELDEETDKLISESSGNHVDIAEQLAAAGPAGVAAAAAIATARKRKRPHSFETNPSVRKRQQTRLIRKLRACIDEYTMRVGQQAVVLITMPGKALHNFKVFGAQPLESVIRTCKHEIMAELEQSLLEQAPQQFKDDANKHELPPLVIDGIPTPVEKMTQAQLRAFIPLMLKYSTGRGKPGWGKETTRPPWWPETLPWANVRSDAREDNEKQRISWTTTLRQIVTNCYKYHGRDDLLPTFDENEESMKQQEQVAAAAATRSSHSTIATRSLSVGERQSSSRKQLADGSKLAEQQAGLYSSSQAGYAGNFVHTITNADGTVSLIQVDPANAQILTLPDGTQVRAVRLQTLGTGEQICGQTISELHEATSLEISAALADQEQQQQQQQQHSQSGQSLGEASLAPDGQIIVTGEDGIQSCYPMSSLVSIPASMYQQFAQGGQQLSIMTADGQTIAANAVSIHTISADQEQALLEHEQQQQQQQVVVASEEQPEHQTEVKTELVGSPSDNNTSSNSDGAANEESSDNKATQLSAASDGQTSNGVTRNSDNRNAT